MKYYLIAVVKESLENRNTEGEGTEEEWRDVFPRNHEVRKNGSANLIK